MNLSVLALILLAWQLLGKNDFSQQKSAPQPKATDMLSDEMKSLLNNAQKLSDKECSQADKAGAIFEIISNPTVQSIASGILGNMGTQAAAPSPQQEEKPEDPHVNSEGYRFETPSAASQEFFRPIDDIADTEVKHKLYWFYDHWYNK